MCQSRAWGAPGRPRHRPGLVTAPEEEHRLRVGAHRARRAADPAADRDTRRNHRRAHRFPSVPRPSEENPGFLASRGAGRPVALSGRRVTGLVSSFAARSKAIARTAAQATGAAPAHQGSGQPRHRLHVHPGHLPAPRGAAHVSVRDKCCPTRTSLFPLRVACAREVWVSACPHGQGGQMTNDVEDGGESGPAQEPGPPPHYPLTADVERRRSSPRRRHGPDLPLCGGAVTAGGSACRGR